MTHEFYEGLGRQGWGSLEQPRTRVALALARTVPAERVLDVGCANGDVSMALAHIGGGSVVGVDIAEVAVQACRSKGIEAHQIDLDREALPFPDARFDLVYMAEVLEHLTRPDHALEEIRRVLGHGGHLLITTPNLACLPNRMLMLAGLQPLYTEVSEEVVLGRGLRVFGQGGRPVGHLRLYTRRALIELLAVRGFELVRVCGAGFHGHGSLVRIETILSHFPGIAMQLVVLARKR